MADFGSQPPTGQKQGCFNLRNSTAFNVLTVTEKTISPMPSRFFTKNSARSTKRKLRPKTWNNAEWKRRKKAHEKDADTFTTVCLAATHHNAHRSQRWKSNQNNRP